ncbi:Holliday junction resolvase Hjc [Methanobacterium formicicum]|uniref:Holliday junction resolvase Hjc n=1 Tax=Methanobacterium formicicum TaxID=2162 RepID=UPI00249298D1|nr:Holliday junction resolvase Hjc [Methanobacterium formicicum]
MSTTIDEIKSIGIEYEHELVRILKNKNFTACRLPGSAAQSPDVLAGDGDSVMVFEVKSTRDSRIKIRKRQIWTLKRYANALKADPWLALKFVERDFRWLFVKISALKSHEKTFSIDYNSACLSGFDIGELISNELQQRLNCQ